VIAGFGGELISHAFMEQQLERHLRPGADRERMATFERRLLRWWRTVGRTLGPASSARAVHDVAALPLLELLEHARPAAIDTSLGGGAALPNADSVLLSVPWSMAATAAWRDAVRRGIDHGASWALICNGHSLRIVDCRRSWSRAGIEFHFDRLTMSPAGIAALWILGGAPAFAAGGERTLRALVTGSDAHASRVCRSLSDGVLAALPRLADALSGGRSRAPVRSSFDQALTLIYRILFLLFAEARAMVPVWNAIYRDAYTIDSLVDRVFLWSPPSGGRRYGLWESLQAISRLAHAGCTAGDLVVTAFNGRLFSPRHAPLAEQRHIPDGIVRDVLLSLATEVTPHGRRRISYHDLGVEQLGSVYERVLEYEPARRGNSLTIERTSTQRKSTASFYTPQALTAYLVRRTLGPLIDGKPAAEILRLRVLDPAMGSGAFLVAACRFMAERCEQALRRDGDWRGGVDDAVARARLRRTIAEQCLYGVDVNATAVQLARVSLWLTTLAADRPLTFLDHHLATGNSLIGAWLSGLSRAPRTRALATRSSLPLFDDAIADDVAGCVLPERMRIAFQPSDSVEAVRGKERALANLTRDGGPLARWTAAADAWCAAALWPGTPPSAGVLAEWLAGAAGDATTLPQAQLQASLERARVLAAEHAAFHWELAFPEAFFDADGRRAADAGFDAVIGNPPWDMLRADTGASSERDQSRAGTTAALRFFRASRVYMQQGTGHANRYQLFVERALQLVKPGGRIGLLLPSGIATDHGSASLRRHLLDRTSIDTWIGFDNRRRIFPIHRSVRFVLLSTTNAGSTDVLRFRCGVTDPGALHAPDANDQMLSLSRSRIEALSPEHLTIPELTNPTALAILTGVSQRVPALGDVTGWNVRFGRELNATDDRPHFVSLGNTRGAIIPIVEGKQLAPFHVDLTRSTLGLPRRVAVSLLDESASFARSRIAYRDVASATNKLTLIAAMLPAGTVSTHTVFCQKTPLEDEAQWCLLGLMNSLVANYLVRLQVTTHVTTALMARLPVPKPAGPIREHIAALSRSLATTGTDAAPDSYAKLNTLAAREYGVSRDEYAFIVESFPLLPAALRERCIEAYSTKSSHGNTETQKHGRF
jgi:N-6 DNA Methylase/Eco57I restriction-modification methylase